MVILNDLQRIALQQMIDGKNIFLTGGAGTGKSTIISEFKKYLENTNKEYIICAPTGIASINIEGVTLHRAFKIPLGPILEKPKFIPQILKDIECIIIDEISMVRIDVFEYVASMIINTNRFRQKNCMPMIQVIVCGDFFQLPPVITENDREVLEKFAYSNLRKGFAFESPMWSIFNFLFIELNEVVRQSDYNFISALHNIRIGNKNAISWFNNACSNVEQKDAILVCGTNKKADEKNKLELDKIANEKKWVFKSEITGIVNENDKVAPDVIELKVGCRVMVLINDTIDDEYQNGSLGNVTKITKDEVTVKIDEGNTVVITRNTWKIENYKGETNSKGKVSVSKETIGTYTQFPLKLGYAVTIHKSQGKTFDKANIDPWCWDCGQLYVALSRVSDIQGLSLMSPIQPRCLVCDYDVKRFYNYI